MGGGYGISVPGYSLRWECFWDEEYRGVTESLGPPQECLDKHRAICGEENYTPEILPGQPGCLDGTSGRFGIKALSFSPDLLDVPWAAKDVLSLEESEALWSLNYIYEKDESAGQRILEMPLLMSIDSRDVSALRSLVWLERATLQHVLAHPSLQGGITDEWTDIVATLSLVLPAYEEFVADEQETAEKRELIDTILNPDRTTVLRRSLDLPLAGEVRATVIWPDAGEVEAPVRFMDSFEHAIRAQEEFMGVRFPLSFAIMIVADIVEFGAAAYSGDGIVMVAKREYGSAIPHEVGHTYFGPSIGNRGIFGHWIREGGAELMAIITRDKSTAGQTRAPGCESFANIAEWDYVAEENGPLWVIQQGCHYWLGQNLFQALYEGLGDRAFREGFARLYLGKVNGSDWECTGVYEGLCQVRTAFVDNAPAKEAAVADEIIARYYGSVP